MLRSSNNAVGDEIDAWKLEVPGPSFITQGVSPRRDVNYDNLFESVAQRPVQKDNVFRELQTTPLGVLVVTVGGLRSRFMTLQHPS
jgi:hypothetical protein